MGKSLDKAIDKVTLFLTIVGGVGFCAISIVLLINIILRAVFNGGITGQYEIVQYGMLVCLGLGLVRTTYNNRHIQVDLLVSHMNRRISAAILFIGRLICTGVYGYAAYLFIGLADSAIQYNKVTDLYRIPFVYVYLVFLVFLALAMLVFFYQACKYFVEIFVNPDQNTKPITANTDEPTTTP